MSRNRLLKDTKLISLFLVPLLLASIFAVPAQASFTSHVYVAIKLGKKIVASKYQPNISFTDAGTPSATITVSALSDNLYNRVNRKYGTQFTVTIPKENTGDQCPGCSDPIDTFQDFLSIEHGKKPLTVKVNIYSQYTGSAVELSLTVILEPPTT